MSTKVNSWDAFKYHWLIWKFSGFQSPACGSRWHFPYKLYALIITLLIPVYFPFSLTLESFNAENLSHFCEIIYVAITDIAVNVKFVLLYIVRKQLLAVRPLLQVLDARASTTVEEKNILQAGINSAKRWFLTFLRLYHLAYVTRVLMVTVLGETTLLHPAWFPFEHVTSHRNFWLAFTYQAVALFVQCAQACAVHTYPQAYLSVLCGHIQAVALRIQQIGEKSSAQRRNSTQSLAVRGCVTQALEDDKNYAELVTCIKDHITIIKLFSTIQKPISGTCFVQFLCTGMVQCTMGIYLLYSEFDVYIMLNALLFFVAVSLETFVLCYYCDMFYQECDNFAKAIYNCNWTHQSEKFKKTLLIFLTRSQKINTVLAGNLIPVQLSTFVQVVKTAYSIFTLLSNFK